jgi:hypothetical protein
MNKPKFTPGSWAVVKTLRGFNVESEYQRLCLGVAGFDNEATHEANARLIAAAPDLLEALQKIAAIRWGHDGDCGANAIADAVIAKALGE